MSGRAQSTFIFRPKATLRSKAALAFSASCADESSGEKRERREVGRGGRERRSGEGGGGGGGGEVKVERDEYAIEYSTTNTIN